jgi:RNA polymerase sigma-70 factor (ECF subfamily)
LPALFSEDHVQFVLRTLRRLGAPTRDIEDLAQEVFVVAHRRAGTFDVARHPAPWLFGITKNVLRDYRKLARNRYEVFEPVDRLTTSQDDEADLLRRSIAALPEELSDLVILCDLSGLTVSETATALGIPEGTLKDRLRRARRDLRVEIDRRRKEVTLA